MSVPETVLIFVGIPAVITLVLTALALAGDAGRNARRYRPGRPFDFTPVWFLSAPEYLADYTGVALPATAPALAVTGGEVEPKGAPKRAGVTGGASDRW